MIARAGALAALLAVAATSSGNATEPGLTPHVTEFGPTFSSDLGGIALAPDGSVWLNERDRVAHVTRDGRVVEHRLPFEVYQGRPRPSGPIGLGPGGDMWFLCEGAVGRIAPDGRIRLYGQTSGGFRRYPTAFAVSRNDAWYAYYPTIPGSGGIFHLDANGSESSSDTDLDLIILLAAAPDGALWIAASTRAQGNVVTLYYRPRGGPRRKVLDVTRPPSISLFGTTPSGALLAGRFEWSPRRAHVERVDPDGTVTMLAEFDVQGYGVPVGGIASARDGSTWIAETDRNRVARVAPDGSVREFRRGLPQTAGPMGIVADDTGGAWFTDFGDGLLAHARADGTIAVIGHGPITESTPAFPAVAADGAVWYRESFDWRRRLARLAPDGTTREFPHAGDGPLLARGNDVLTSTPQGIAAVAPDGALRVVAPSVAPPPQPPGYFYGGPFAGAAATAPDGAAWYGVDGAFARVLRDGAVTTIAAHGIRADSMAFDAAGVLWFTDTYHSLLGSVTPDGRVRTHTRGLTRWHSGPQWIARGPDDAMWFTELRDRIGRIAPDGTITEFAVLPYRSSPGGIVTGPDGALWFTLWHGNVLGRITTDGRNTRLYRGLVTPSRGNEHDPDAVLVPDGHGGFWFNESEGGRMAHLTFR